MDSKTPSKELPKELARELLISISNYTPERVPDLKFALDSKGTGADVVVNPNAADEADKYRSELISISYTPSPDTEASPLSLGT